MYDVNEPKIEEIFRKVFSQDKYTRGGHTLMGSKIRGSYFARNPENAQVEITVFDAGWVPRVAVHISSEVLSSDASTFAEKVKEEKLGEIVWE